MKQVIFICLLSISLCLSAPSDDAPNEHAPSPPISPAQGATVATTKATPAPESNTPSVPLTTQNKTAESTPKHEKNVTTTPITPVEGNPTTTTTVRVPTPSSAPQPSTTTTTVSTPVSSADTPTSTPKPEHKETVPSKTPEPVTVQARGFDGASFVGGIILTLGLLAIGFMGFKYYKNQTERNYHTL